MFDIGGRRTMVAGVAVSAASVVVPVVMGNSETSAKLDLLDGTAWLSSEAAGNVVRVNGETGLVDARLDLGELAEEVLVSQDDGVVLVRIGDQVRSIDLANLDWGAATGASAGTGLVVGDGVAYMVSPGGHVGQLDPVTLETVGEVDLGAPPAGAGVVARERLVLPTGDGAVKVVDGDELASEVDAGSPGDAIHVTRVGDEVAILNQSERTVRSLDAGSGVTGDPAPVELPSGELQVPTELPDGRLWLIATRSGELDGIHVGSGQATVRAAVAPARHALTAPAAAEGRVYLVDRTSAEVVAVDASSLEVVRREPLGVPDAARVELVVEGAKVFVNDRASAVAVVIDGDEYTRVDKSGGEGAARPARPTDVPDPGPEADDPESVPPTTAAPPANDPGPPPPPPAPPPPPPDPGDPPGRMPGATKVESDGTVELTWQAAPGDGPIEYEVTASPSAGDPVVTRELSHTFTGLENGITYTFTIVPRNEHGRGEAFEVSATPATQPTIDNAGAERTGDRRFRVTFDVDDGGRRIDSCTIEGGGTPRHAISPATRVRRPSTCRTTTPSTRSPSRSRARRAPLRRRPRAVRTASRSWWRPRPPGGTVPARGPATRGSVRAAYGRRSGRR
ncbi:MAG TPA: hypothetical protein VFZ68_00320 [Acidimicrobiales bacterium]